MTDSILLLDKEAGPTSHDLVARVRREVGRGTKVGHSGTLDPFATGLMIILIGRAATRTQRLFMALAKGYETTARFGAVSTTGDRDGELTVTGRIPQGDLSLPTGRFMQRPPAHSAVKVGGRRAYHLARAGEVVELEEREITVEEFVETARQADRRSFRIRCSSGTYVRSLVSDLGDAYCETLRRTAIGPFSVDECPSEPIPLAAALRRFMPEVVLDPESAEDLAHGRPTAGPPAGVEPGDGGPAIATFEDRLVAVVERVPGIGLKVLIGFPSD